MMCTLFAQKYPGEKKNDTYNGISVYRYSKWKQGGHLSEYMSSLLKGGLARTPCLAPKPRFRLYPSMQPTRFVVFDSSFF